MRTLILFVMLFFIGNAIVAQTDASALPDNSPCLKCHGQVYYSYNNVDLGKDVHKKMNPYFIINKKMLQNGVHKSFLCTDCHSTDYEAYPHDSKLKLEEKYTCNDCHAGDENFAKFKFEEIEEKVKNSVHGKFMGEDFKCEMCHNQHYYKLGARNIHSDVDVKSVVLESNQMCLNCHEYTNDRFYLLPDSVASINNTSHAWLPNQALHFQKVRCIECHGKSDNDLMVSHSIQGKEKAVKLCVECHSDNSILMSSLYRYQTKESRDAYGFFNGAMMNKSFVIGANRNYYLNAASIIIFCSILLVVLVHAILRIILKK